MTKYIYLSGPYSYCPSEARQAFAAFKSWCEVKGMQNLWVPTERIPESSTWEQSMDICEKVFKERQVSCVYLIVNDHTFTSSGVMRELAWADSQHVKVHFVRCFKSSENVYNFCEEKYK